MIAVAASRWIGPCFGAEGSTWAAKTHCRSRGLKALGGHAGEMNTQECGGAAMPTEGRGVARPEGEGAASHAKRVNVMNAARCFNLPCWASRSSRRYPLREAERGVRKSHVYTAVREGGCALYFRIRGAGVPLKGGGCELECLQAMRAWLLCCTGCVLTWLPP